MRRIQKVMKVVKAQKHQPQLQTHIERCDAVWSAIRKSKSFDVGSITRASGCAAGFVHRYVNRLMLAGYLSVKPQIPANLYTLIKDSGIRAPMLNAKGQERPVSGYQKVWSAIPVLKIFTVKDIALAADVSLRIPQAYLRILHETGYLRIVDQPSGNSNQIVYSLLPGKHSGPKAPRPLESGVYDENLHRTVDKREGA